jgi:hypothetical protein
VFSSFAFITKPKRTHARKPAVITNPRWLAYATAGAASAFTGANSAEATIHYSGRIDLPFGAKNYRSVHFQLDQPGDSFFLKHSADFSGRRFYSGFAHFGIVALVGGSFAGFFNTATHSGCGSNQVPYVSKLHRSEPVSRRAFSAANSGFMAGSGSICERAFGEWAAPDRGFIGFKFNNGSGVQYGWVRIKFWGMQSFHNFTLLDYAYADPGEPILAGQKSSNEMVPEESNDIVPQEGSLGALALGAAGLLAWRKKRSRTAR